MSRPSTGMGFLAVTGSTPPSRDGAIKSSCRTVSFRCYRKPGYSVDVSGRNWHVSAAVVLCLQGSRAAAESPLDALTHALIKKMREKFGVSCRTDQQVSTHVVVQQQQQESSHACMHAGAVPLAGHM